MKRIKFSKYESLGNDFIIIDDRSSYKHSEINFPISLSAGQIKGLCRRHFGVGADGIIFLGNSSDIECLVRMRIVNADGSIAKICGNGLRCVVLWLFHEGEFGGCHSGKIMTDVGAKEFSFENGSCIINMGLAKLYSPRRYDYVMASLEVLDKKTNLVSEVDIGNPHLVLKLRVNDDVVASLAPKLKKLTGFDGDANVDFVSVDDTSEISLKVFERGAGLTLACGSGACAAVAALVAQGELATDKWIKVKLNGGTLQVMSRLDNDNSVLEFQNMSMRGGANKVFAGSFSFS